MCCSMPLPAALVNLVRRNGRRYGGYVVHIGVLLIALGIIGNEFYQSEGQANLKVGESASADDGDAACKSRLDRLQRRRTTRGRHDGVGRRGHRRQHAVHVQKQGDPVGDDGRRREQ